MTRIYNFICLTRDSKSQKQLNEMKFRKKLWSCLIMAFFSACQQAENVKEESDDLRMSLIASINNQSNAPSGRYVGDAPGEEEFGSGDVIGVFRNGGGFSQWEYGSPSWTSEVPVYWPDKSNPYTFYAFFPYDEGASSDAVPMPDLLGQDGTFESVKARDFLVASVTQTYGGNGLVNFNESHSFKHVSSLLKLVIPSGGDSKPFTLKNLKITGEDITSSTTYSFSKPGVNVVPGAESNVLDLELDHILKDGDLVLYCMVNAKSDNSANVSLSIEYEADGELFVAQKNGFSDNLFSGGVMQEYTIRINGLELSVTGALIKEWEQDDNIEVDIEGEKQQSDETD